MKALSTATLSLLISIFIQSAVVVGIELPTKQSAQSRVAEIQKQQIDRSGDALPAGAILRLGTTNLRNAQGVEGVAFSPDGKSLASCGWGDSIRIWDVATSRPVKRFVTDEGDGTFGVAFSADGAKLASVGERGFVRMWDVSSGKQLWKVLGHLERAALPRQFGTRVYAVAFSPDGSALATGGDDRIVKLWDAAIGKTLREFDTQDREIGARPVAFSPDGKLLAAGCSNGKIIVWSPASGKVVYEIKKAHQRDVSSLVFTSDGKELISGGVRVQRTGKNTVEFLAQIRAWDAATGSARPAYETPPDVTGETTLVLSPDGRKLYSAHHDRIIIWDVDLRLPTRYLRFEGAQLGGRPHGLAVSPQGRLLASKAHWNRRNKVWLWDLEKNEEVFAQTDTHGSSVLSVRYSPDGSQIVTGSADNTVRLWNASTGEQVRLLDEGTGWVRFVDFSPDGKQVVLGRETHEPKQFAYKGEIKVYNVVDGQLVMTMAAPDRVMCGALSADAKTVAAAVGLEGHGKPDDLFGGDGGTKVIAWDIATGRQLASFDRAQTTPNDLEFSADGSELTLVSQDGSMLRWNLREAKGVPVANVPPAAGRGGFYKSAYSVSKSLLVYGGVARDGNKRIGELSLVDLANGETLWEKKFDDLRPFEIAISPDGKVLATYLQGWSSSGRGGRLAFWSIPDKKELSSFELTDDAVRSLAFSRDGSHLVSGMELGDALVWKIAPASQK